MVRKIKLSKTKLINGNINKKSNYLKSVDTD